jgi:DNA-binding IclR family transcriptional regulator
VRGQPGITITELAAKMGIKQNYPYRVLPGLAQDGKLENKGRGYPPPRRREDQPLASITGFSWVKE